ncbi:MAG: hypothetical protein ACRCU2_16270 [Planktothrix sp.]
MPPTGGETSQRNSDINPDLGLWNRQTKLGINFDPSGGFTLPNAEDFSPESLTKIVPWGQFFTMDAAGCVLNDCHTDKILPPWTALVIELRQASLDVWKNRLQGLYLRGSVPRGLAIFNHLFTKFWTVVRGRN